MEFYGSFVGVQTILCIYIVTELYKTFCSAINEAQSAKTSSFNNFIMTNCYSPVCAPGYTDVNGQCTACPKNTVKEAAGNGNCTACPAGLQTQNPASSSFSLCGEYFLFFLNVYCSMIDMYICNMKVNRDLVPAFQYWS